MQGLNERDLRALWNRMKEFESMNVAELKRSGSYHAVHRSLLSQEAKRRLAALHLEDIEEIHSFRVSGTRRFWCISWANVFALLWWDPEHQVYTVAQRNT